MKTCEIIEGLTILEKYRKGDTSYNCGAEHDEIYAYATDTPVSPRDLKRLVEIGWFQSDVSDASADFTAEYYDPHESWMCFV